MIKAVMNHFKIQNELTVLERTTEAQPKNGLETRLEIRSGAFQMVLAVLLGLGIIGKALWAQTPATAPTVQASDARLAEADKLNAQVVSLYGRGQYSAALDPARKALAIREEVLGAEHPSTGTSLNNLAELYQSIGQYAQALPLSQRALAISEKLQGAEHPSTGFRLNNLAGLYQSMGQYAWALPLYRRALAISEKAQGPEHPNTGTYVNNLAELYRSMGQHAQALPLSQRALAISEKAEGAEHPSTGVSLNNLAELYRSMGQYAQALPLSQRALAISEKAEGPDHPNTGERLNNLAVLYESMGQYARALPLYQRALAISEKAQGAEHPNTGVRLNNLAELYRSMGQYAQALPLSQRALAILEKAQGPEHPSTGTNLNNLAGLYRSMGQYAQALPLSLRALAISEKAEGAEHPNTGVRLNDLALLYRSMGQYAQALSLSQRALAVSEKGLGIEHPHTGTSVNNLAVVYESMGQYAQALPLYQRALAISEKAQGPEHPSTGSRLGNLAGLYQAMGQYAQALPLYQRALAISEKTQGPEHPSTGRNLNNLAGLYRSMGQYAQALPMHQRALAISEKNHSPAFRWTALGNLMVVHSTFAAESLRNLPLSVWYGKQAVSTLQSMRGGMSSLDQSLQRGFLNTVEGYYTKLANLLIESGRIPEAEQVLAMLKEKELGDLLRSGPEDRKARVDEVGNEPKVSRENAELVARGVKSSIELAALEQRAFGGGKLSDVDQTRKSQLLMEAEVWHNDYQKWLAGLSAVFANSTQGANEREKADGRATNLQLMVSEDPGAVGLHYSVSDDQVGIVVATARGSFGRFSKVKRVDLNQQVVLLRQAIVNRADVQPAARELYRMLIEPIEKDLAEAQAKTLVLSLTDTLRYLPFGALNDGERFLVERYAFSLYSSAGAARPQINTQLWQVSAMGVTQARAGYDALPAVGKELQGIVRTAGSDLGLLPGRIDLDEAFGRARFEEALSGRNSVVHVASHFNFKPGDEVGSALLTGQGDPISLKQLSVMNFRKIEQLTLSACETATGGGVNENGAEVEGLAAAVQKQGAQAVLATLWKVADESTGALMREFYAGRATGDKPLSRAQALRRAQLMLIWGNGSTTTDVQRGGTREGSDKAAMTQQVTDPSRPWAHPFYWAPFVLSGNWL